jgi:hypothetical protein
MNTTSEKGGERVVKIEDKRKSREGRKLTEP